MAKIRTPIPSLKLNDGRSIPMIGYGTGTAWYKGPHSPDIDQATIDACKMAIRLGYYHLDGAEAYGNETELGQAIAESKVPRDELFVTTKVLPFIADIPKALNTSLKKLQLDYIDLYLIHAPFFADGGKDEAALQKAWAEMEKLQEAGLAKSIGLSNFYPSHLKAVLKTAKVVPAMNQMELHPYLQHRDLLALHKEHGIATAAYGPQTPVTKARGGPVDEYLAALAKKYGVSEGDICIRWCLDQDIVVITTSGKEQRLSDYLRSTRFKLTPEEVKKIGDLGEGYHFRGFWKDKFAPDDRS